MTSSIPFALPPVLSQRQFMQYYAIARAMGHSGGLEGTQAAYQAQYAWSAIDQITSGQPADKPPVNHEVLEALTQNMLSLQQSVERMLSRVEANQKMMGDLATAMSAMETRLRALENPQPPVSESPNPVVSES